MYYNTNDKILITKLPKNILKEDGSMFIDFHRSDVNTLAEYGFYTVRSDNSAPPTNNSTENKSAQQIIIDKPYVDIHRTWIDHSPNNQYIDELKNKE